MRLTTVITAAALLSGCSNPTYYQGLGRPEYEAPARRLPLSIVEVYVTDADPTQRFALLVNTGTTDITDPNLTLTGPAGEVKLDMIKAEAPLKAGAALAVSLATLTGGGLLGGELAVTSPDGTVEAYLAWGSDQLAAGSLLAAAAYQSGATTFGEFVPTGSPPPAGVAFVNSPAGVGCAPPSQTLAGLATPTPCQ